MYTFCKTTFAARTKSHVEGSVALCGGCWLGWICMIKTKLHHGVMQGCCSTWPTTMRAAIPNKKEVFLDIVEDLLDCSTKFQGIYVSEDHQSANHILIDRRFGTQQNLPHEQVTDIAGHACVSLIGVLRHLFAHKIGIGFAKETDIKGSQRDMTWANSCPAMDALFEHMKK